MTKVASRKAKGRQFEKSVARLIAEMLDLPLEDVLASSAGASGIDIQLSDRAKKVYPYHTECKNQKKLSIPAWIRQAEEGVDRAGDGLEPIVVFKQHRNSKKYVVMSFTHLLMLLRKIWEIKT